LKPGVSNTLSFIFFHSIATSAVEIVILRLIRIVSRPQDVQKDVNALPELEFYSSPVQVLPICKVA
jgi:hypothetical protein